MPFPYGNFFLFFIKFSLFHFLFPSPSLLFFPFPLNLFFSHLRGAVLLHFTVHFLSPVFFFFFFFFCLVFVPCPACLPACCLALPAHCMRNGFHLCTRSSRSCLFLSLSPFCPSARLDLWKWRWACIMGPSVL
ncbi:hypothetical protein HOY82DRAFT_135335 [Tuber indicum]|nr:hypothetical protein HOY82DRAFT_135335 [Tuber indicum]